MTNDGIEQLIDALNSGTMRDRVFLARLSATVDFGKVWVQEPRGGIAGEGSNDFFFIRDPEGMYVAAVFDMTTDLHIFVKSEHRGRGHMASALTTVILPWLLQQGRRKQPLTYQDPHIGTYCHQHLGASLGEPGAAEINLDRFSNSPEINATGIPLSEKDHAEIRTRVSRAVLHLRMLQEKLEMAYGSCGNTCLEDLINDVCNLDDVVLNFIDEKNNSAYSRFRVRPRRRGR